MSRLELTAYRQTLSSYVQNIVLTAQRAAKYSVLAGNKKVNNEYFEQAIAEGSRF